MILKAPIGIPGFEAKFRQNPDPWNYAHSAFEAYKRRMLRLACGDRHYARGLELACANGETTKILAPRCLKLHAVDGSSTAIAEARRRVRAFKNVTFSQGRLPDELPAGPFDLIVASEILYYLRPHDIERLLVRLDHALAGGGRFVCLHHVVDFDDAACRPAQAQEMATRYFGQRMRQVVGQPFGRFRIAAFEKMYR